MMRMIECCAISFCNEIIHNFIHDGWSALEIWAIENRDDDDDDNHNNDHNSPSHNLNLSLKEEL